MVVKISPHRGGWKKFVGGKPNYTTRWWITVTPSGGYDLRATSGRCPECGTISTAPPRASRTATADARSPAIPPAP